MKKSAVLICMALLAGCLTKEEIAQKQTVYKNTIPKCYSAEECNTKWAAARTWLINNSKWKIKTYTPDYMDTHYSGDYAETRPQIMVVKKLLPQGEGYSIQMTASCSNTFGCEPNELDLMIDFNKFLLAHNKPIGF